jgi:hypothetical protein
MSERETGIVEDVHAKTVSITGVVCLIVIALVLGATYLLLHLWHAHANGANAPLAATPPDPMLESAPQVDRAQYAAEKDKLLRSFGWVDRQHGIARIPIEHAMALIVARDAAPRRGASQR